MTTAAQGDPPPSLLLGPVLGTLPAHLLQTEVLRRLGPTDLASLAGAGRGCAAAVAATALMQWAKHAKLRTLCHLGCWLPPLCVKEACSYAARCGNRDVLEWLHNTGCLWTSATCALAADGGHLEVLQWAREHGCPCGAVTSTNAARSGHLEVLRWAREHSCPWHAEACIYAARAGQLEVLQWIRENDADNRVWSAIRVRRNAAGPRKQEVLTWLDEVSGP